MVMPAEGGRGAGTGGDAIASFTCRTESGLRGGFGGRGASPLLTGGRGLAPLPDVDMCGEGFAEEKSTGGDVSPRTPLNVPILWGRPLALWEEFMALMAAEDFPELDPGRPPDVRGR